MNVTIRVATAEDEQRVVDLWRTSGLVKSHNDPSVDFQFALGGKASDILVAESEGRIVGSVLVGHDGHRGWLYYVSVTPAQRGVGIGREMIDAAEQWLVAQGIKKAQLLVREENEGVVGFYESVGFEVASRIVMEKWLLGGKSN